MTFISRNRWTVAIWITVLAWALIIATVRQSFADGLACPNPAESCRVVYISPQEEKALMQPNGVLDTAAQGRQLELGQFVVYFKTRIGNSIMIHAPMPKDQSQAPTEGGAIQKDGSIPPKQ